ncbi:protein STICHEL [Rutidosis leptorrhynchoides]|uniref:protein STICHEL n=1 Tax=Rutidosis leptorrhynchoides TaxID=125765 RepID=UPI003A999FCC
MSANRNSSYSGGAVVVDPSNLHLKKELTQIRKAARTLRDPGTTSSWRSPLASSRSTSLVPGSSSNHYNHHYFINPDINNNINNNSNSTSNVNVNVNVSSSSINNGNGRKEKKVFLYNWKTQRSESETSASIQRKSNVDDEIGDGDDSLSDARNECDSKSVSSSTKMFSACRDVNDLMMPPIRRASLMKNRKKEKRGLQSSVDALKSQMQRRMDLVEGFDDVNSDDVGVKGSSVTSPLLSRIKASKMLRGGSTKDDSSYCYSTPPLSTSSFNKYWARNPGTVGSWDAMTGSLNDGDDDDDDDDDELGLSGRKGCGIPCYWSSSKRSTPKGSCYSPSFSDTLRRKGSSLLCGSQSSYHRRRYGSSTGAYKKKRLTHKTSHVPLLTNGDESRDHSSDGTDDELSTNYGELDLEALSRLDGRRWSTGYKSQEGLELVALNEEIEGGSGSPSSVDNSNCFSYKYRPMFFEDIVGQNVVVQSLVNSINRGRIAPIYLFQGPRGTGKTSTARIFAAALNCLATGDTRPCGICRECAEFISGKSRVLTEMDGSNKKGVDKVKILMKKLQIVPSTSTFIRHDVYVIDECHLLPSTLWLAFQKFLEEPPKSVVFIFITTDLDNVPRAVLSRCQKYTFNKIKDSEIVNRLMKISEEENLDVEEDALDLIAMNVEGSLRDAETMLDQLSLLGKRITTDLVNELVGVVSDEKLLELLELAMSSNTAETVKRARELMDLGVDPMVLMSQMATLIMDIIAGTYQVVDARYGDSLYDGRSLTEAELERLKHALKLLSEAEKQLRLSSERSTWFTATLLQLGSAPSADPTPSGSSRRQSSRTTDDDPSATFKDIYFQKQKTDSQYTPQKSTPNPNPPKLYRRHSASPEDLLVPMRQILNVDGPSVSHEEVVTGNSIQARSNSNILDDIWVRCIAKCHSKTLRQLLHTYGNLVSISEDKGTLVAYIVFRNKDIKNRAERFLSSITNSFEIVLHRNVEVRTTLLSDDDTAPNNGQSVVPKTKSTSVDNRTHSDSLQESNNTRKSGNPVQRIESIIHEQRLETAWLQTAEKGTPGSLNRLKPERNQVLPQDGIGHLISLETSQQQLEDEVTRELNLLKINGGKTTLSKEHNISPSLLHDSNLVARGYESGSGGAGGCFCWNKPKQNRRGKMKPGTPVGPRRGARFSLFGECGKQGKTQHRSRR